ncbi:AAA family ATPase [Paenibacillus sp. L3-i20]|uniref:AAA family ATPase n=1 Tax=Paenibacillus sp. L3-i20 TaxID=2905833 RepID=UPI0020BEB915|nr:AAA family ATPase [Paenibacillus sp. L3-i20]
MAQYKQQLIPQNQGNPFIEAIPDRVTIEQFIDLLSSTPSVLPEYMKLPVEDRLEFVQQIKPHFWLTLPSHFDKYRNIYYMIKIGYQSRNPLNAAYNRQFAIGVDKIFQGGIDQNGANIAGVVQTAQSHVEIAISGWGKSQVYERMLLRLFPQVIHHSEYSGRKIPVTQVTWLKVECPFNKSVGAFCKNVYAEVDRILGTDFYERFGEKPGKLDTLARRLIKVVAQINLGVLVIDEIQKIQKAYSGGAEDMIDFITELVNTIGIPVVMLGSYKALYLFKDSLANTRRGIANGFTENISGYMVEDSWEWNEFIDNLWDIQYTKKYTEITDEIKKALYENSLGIPDLAVKLFMHAQSSAIVSGGDEKITAFLIKDVASKSMKLVQPIFKKMKSGDTAAFAALDDIKPDWVALNGYIREAEHRVAISGNLAGDHSRALQQKDKYAILKKLNDFAACLGISSTKAESLSNQVYDSSGGMGDLESMFAQLAQLALGNATLNFGDQEHNTEGLSKKRYSKKVKPALEEQDIRYIVQMGHRQGETTGEALKKSGLIRGIDDLLGIR